MEASIGRKGKRLQIADACNFKSLTSALSQCTHEKPREHYHYQHTRMYSSVPKRIWCSLGRILGFTYYYIAFRNTLLFKPLLIVENRPIRKKHSISLSTSFILRMTTLKIVWSESNLITTMYRRCFTLFTALMHSEAVKLKLYIYRSLC